MRLGSDLLCDLRDTQICLFVIGAEFQCALIIMQSVHQAVSRVQCVAATDVGVGQCGEHRVIIRTLPSLLFEARDLRIQF